MSDDAPTQTLPTAPSPQAALPLTGFAAGITGAALVVAGVWGLHVLTPGGGAVGSVGWVVLLCLAFTALGKGITLLRRALAPLTAVVVAPLAPISAPVRAAAGIVIGAAGIWWVIRGHAATWWTHTTGAGSATGWTLTSQLVAVAFMVVFGALLFGGAKTLATAIFANSGTRHRDNNAHNSTEGRWALWWSSHPGLGLTLLAGGAALVFLSGYIVPRVSAWLTGDDPMAALAAIAAILTVAFAANTWWWKALTGWWTWAHTHGGGGGGASPLGQMHAGAAVIALIWFSAMGFGLATPADYTGPGAAPLALADCPPDCGGGSNGSNSYGPNASQFQPPQMPAQQPDYQGGNYGGSNQAPLDQNSGISIYNRNPGQSGPQQAGQNIGQQTGQRAAHGEPLPNYGPWQPDAQPPAQAPAQQPPVQQAPQAPQQPAQAPQNPGGQQPAQQAPQQPVQQAPQQQPGAQQPQGQPGQTQPGQQQPQNPANQQNPPQQQPQKQPDQTPQKQPDTPKKNPIDPTDLATAATRRGSQQAAQQGGQQVAQQGAQQATQQTTQATQQATQQGAEKSGETAESQHPEMNTKIGNVGDAIDKSAGRAAQQAAIPKQSQGLGLTQGQLNRAAEQASGDLETVSKFGNKLGLLGYGLEAMNGVNEIADQVQAGKPGIDAAIDVVPKTVGSIAGGWAGAGIGAEWGASAGFVMGGPAGAVIGAGVGAVVGGLAGSEFGKSVGSLASEGLQALKFW